MEKTPSGTSVGVADPYAFAGRCDFVTEDGRCRFALEHAASDPAFARERRREDYACPIVAAEDPTSTGAANADGEEANDGDRASEDDRASGDRHASGDQVGEGVRGDAERSEGAYPWRECPHYRSRTRGRRCVRCGLEERRTTDPGERPLLEEHHLSYAGSGSNSDSETGPASFPPAGSSAETSHEITVSLCRWCHAKIHRSWAGLVDEASPDPEAIAAREGRRSLELAETAFETAAKRRENTTSEE